MSPETLLEQFDAVADAPGGVQRLREMILQLAVRGKLVPQDPNDEPASVLLERIEAEKRRLYAEGKTGKSKRLPPIRAAETPFDVPHGWEWVWLGDVSMIEMGNSPPGTTYNTTGVGMPLINGPSEFSPDPLGTTIQKQYTSAPTKLCSVGDLLICVRGATTGRTNIAGFDACIGRGVASIRAGDIQPYINRLVVSQRDHIFSLGSGSTFPSIAFRHLAGLAVPLPPLSEQRRIVEKVDQLMALCDGLEERQRRRVQKRDRLNRAALHHLTAAVEDGELAHHWFRIREHFDLLYDAPETVTELRQAILQLAVRGKLVPQDPRDEPASVLLEQIEAEKNRLYREGKIGKPKKLSAINPDEVPFEVPEGWEWVRVGEICGVTGGIQKSPKRRPVSNHYPYLRVANVQRGSLDLSEIQRFELAEGELERFRLLAGDLLVVEGNGSETEIGRCARWGGELSDCVHQNHVIRVRPHIVDLGDFLLRFLNSPAGIEEMKRLAVTTSGLYNLSVGKITTIAVPLPPLSEQRRIVAKVNCLLAVCDELEAKLARARTQSQQVAASVVHHLSAA